MFVFLCAVVVVIFLLHKFLSQEYGYFEAKGIPYSKPMLIVGSRKDFILRNKSILTVMKDFYDEFRDDKISGMFDFRTPVYVIRDPHLIKQLAVKEFDHFVDHTSMLDGDPKSLFGRSLVNLRGQKWRDMRATLSPAFTGSKMRQMFELMNLVGQQFANAIMDQIKNGGKSAFEFRELSRKFSVDVIATCALGIEVNSFQNPKNEFNLFANDLTGNAETLTSILKHMGYSLVPKLMAKLKVSLFSEESTKFFESAIKDTMKIREEQGIMRPDLINQLMQAKKGKLSHELDKDSDKVVDGFATVEESQVGKMNVTRQWEDDDLVAQTFVFFFAGFDDVSTMMSFIAYELMVSPDCQTKLQNEIDELHEKINGNPVNYNQIQGMKYMDQVVCETLRKWPTPIIDRRCTKDFKLECDGKKILIEKGRSFYILAAGLHFDERYFPSPDKFDPERFNEENRKNIDPGTYLPFGIGPRNCIGSRFALTELKTIIYYLLLNFNFEPTEKTQIPLKLMLNTEQIIPEKGVLVKFTPRKQIILGNIQSTILIK